MNKKRILFVDDEPMIVILMKKRLEANGYEVETLTDSSAVVETAAKKKPDMVLLDIMMPGLNGYEVCKALKARTETEKIPVIMFTANQADGFIKRALEAGAVAVVNKPVVADVLDVMRRYFTYGKIEDNDEDAA